MAFFGRTIVVAVAGPQAKLKPLAPPPTQFQPLTLLYLSSYHSSGSSFPSR